jgi:hypothetical protein
MIEDLLTNPTKYYKVRPETYPLPLTPEGVAYWELNMALCVSRDGWGSFQKNLSMAEIIPHIIQARSLLATVS